jgi:alkylation response protein AidB-like acyl-CoA dehydrogenase
LFNAGWLALGYLDFAAIILGVAEGAFDIALEHTKTRSRKGAPLAQNQAVAHRLANMASEIEQVRSITYDAAQLVDAGKMDRKLHSIAKIAASEMLSSVSIQCIALHGAAGCDPATGVFASYQVAANAWSGEYPNDLHRDMIARELGISLPSLG